MSEEFISKTQDPNINLQDIATLNHVERQHALNVIIERQIHELQDLGKNILDDESVDNSILADMLVFINDNYISIPSIESAINHPEVVSRIGRYAYELFAIHMINYIIPNALMKLDIKDPLALNVVNNDSIKFLFQKVVQVKLHSIQEVYTVSKNETVYDDVLKWTFYHDLFDSNLDDFIENTVKLIVNSYEVEIFSRMIDVGS